MWQSSVSVPANTGESLVVSQPESLLKHSMHGEDELLRRVIHLPTPWPTPADRRPKRPVSTTTAPRWPLLLLGGALLVFVLSATYYLYAP